MLCYSFPRFSPYVELFLKHSTRRAMREWSHSIEYIDLSDNKIEQTFDICMAAVKQNGLALKYIQHVNLVSNLQYANICMAAVQQNGLALKYIQHVNLLSESQYTNICMSAVQQNGLALEYIQHATSEIYIAAIKHDGDAFNLVDSELIDHDLYIWLLFVAIYESIKFHGYTRNVAHVPIYIDILKVESNVTTSMINEANKIQLGVLST